MKRRIFENSKTKDAIKGTLLLFTAVLFLTACNNTSVSEKQEKTDAVSGATNDKASVLDIAKESAVNMVYDSLKMSAPYFFSTIENDAPRVRPIGITLKHNGKIWFHVGKHKASWEQIQLNPNVEIAVVSPAGNFIRITGKAVCVDDKTLDEMVFNDSPGLQDMYNEQTGKRLGHFYISNGTAEFPSDSGTVIVRF